MEEIKEKLTELSVAYINQPFMRAYISAIPHIGGSLDILFSAAGQKYMERRIIDFVNELSEEISSLDASKINQGFFETEQGFDLIIKSFNSAARTRQQEKLKLFSKIIKSAVVTGKEYHEDAPELYLGIIDELSIKELQVATLLYNNDVSVNIKNMKYNAWKLSEAYPQYTAEELSYVLMRLAKTGLLIETTMTAMGSGTNVYQIARLFKEFMDFIGEQKM